MNSSGRQPRDVLFARHSSFERRSFSLSVLWRLQPTEVWPRNHLEARVQGTSSPCETGPRAYPFRWPTFSRPRLRFCKTRSRLRVDGTSCCRGRFDEQLFALTLSDQPSHSRSLTRAKVVGRKGLKVIGLKATAGRSKARPLLKGGRATPLFALPAEAECRQRDCCPLYFGIEGQRDRWLRALGASHSVRACLSTAPWWGGGG